ncbi:MAG: hypothetical protein A2Y07_07205 [Planctomycetes bacterium GWF2_50_10]|nr:MAG: hypothetical protein A2Y07_07205 [Planctomycetes bacterium GWF2_50_10]
MGIIVTAIVFMLAMNLNNIRKGGPFFMKNWKIIVVVLLVAIVGVVVIAKKRNATSAPVTAADANSTTQQATADSNTGSQPVAAIPKLIDLGAGKCVPCKMMKPILDELRTEYKGRFDVVFYDVWENPDQAKQFAINIIPTQIFFDASGKELFRHEGFMSKEDILAKWKELGIDFSGPTGQKSPAFEQLVPAQEDKRYKDAICYMCDGDINPKTLVTVKTAHGDVRLCGPHCYFIMYSCLTEDKTDFENKVTVADFDSGNSMPLEKAVFLVGIEASGRPTIHSFIDSDAAKSSQQKIGGNTVEFSALKEGELSHKCGFCDRVCYPQDAAKVIVNDIQTWGCCSHCALGVAARTGKDIEVHERDRLRGEPIIVKTLNGSISSLEPATAVAWFGQRKKADGTLTSAGCFHQGFFVNAENLKKWVQQNPYETGRQISINQALADKMKLTETQITNACKIGQCSPK